MNQTSDAANFLIGALLVLGLLSWIVEWLQKHPRKGYKPKSFSWPDDFPPDGGRDHSTYGDVDR